MRDLEYTLDNLESILKASLNDEINAINLEKTDSSSMQTVSDDAYCFQSLDDEVFNFDPVVLYGVTDIENDNNGPYNIQKITLSVAIIATDDCNGNVMTRKMFRYQRAIKQTIEKNWSNGEIANKLNIKNLLPVRIADLNGSNTHRVVGIEFVTTLA